MQGWPPSGPRRLGHRNLILTAISNILLILLPRRKRIWKPFWMLRQTVIDDEKDFAYPHKFYQFNEVSGYYNSRLYQSKSGWPFALPVCQTHKKEASLTLTTVRMLRLTPRLDRLLSGFVIFIALDLRIRIYCGQHNQRRQIVLRLS